MFPAEYRENETTPEVLVAAEFDELRWLSHGKGQKI